MKDRHLKAERRARLIGVSAIKKGGIQMKNRMPILFVGHGSPMNAIEDNVYSLAWNALGKMIQKPQAILSFSAHWFTRGTMVNDSPAPAMIYDMYGFPDELYRLQYPAAGLPELAQRARTLIGDYVVIDNNWGIDHGTWSVLNRMFPEADVPIVQFSINTMLTPEQHYSIGQKLIPLRDEGVLLFGSGNIVHNLSRIDWQMDDGQPWAQKFDQYIINAVLKGDHDAVIHYNQAGESSQLSVPTLDHFAPLLYVLSASDANDTVAVFNNVCLLGSMSMTSYLFTEKEDSKIFEFK
jgi:4,5-DOPA dioxygenase extradiol